MNIIGRYRNGNYTVSLYNDGTKVRETNDDDFIPAFAECCDMKITDKCDGGCPFCYEGCTSNGKHGDLNAEFLNHLHPYTELAINGNDLTHPDLVPFLKRMKKQKVIVSMTVNQNPRLTCAAVCRKPYRPRILCSIMTRTANLASLQPASAMQCSIQDRFRKLYPSTTRRRYQAVSARKTLYCTPLKTVSGTASSMQKISVILRKKATVFMHTGCCRKTARNGLW